MIIVNLTILFSTTPPEVLVCRVPAQEDGHEGYEGGCDPCHAHHGPRHAHRDGAVVLQGTNDGIEPAKVLLSD